MVWDIYGREGFQRAFTVRNSFPTWPCLRHGGEYKWGHTSGQAVFQIFWELFIALKRDQTYVIYCLSTF